MFISKRVSQALGLHELRKKRFYRHLLSEFLGVTWLLLITASLSSRFEGKNHDVVRNSLCAALAVATIVWSLANASSHINPAISTAFCVTGHISPVRALCYVIVQCSGSCFGTYLGTLLTPEVYPGFAVNKLHPTVSYGQAIAMEALCTSVLAFTVFSTVDQTRHDHHGSGPLAIGLAVGLSHFFGEEFTGASMNPARSLGPALISGDLTNISVYILGPLLGSISTSIFYHYVIAGDASPKKFVDEMKDLFSDCISSKQDDDNEYKNGDIIDESIATHSSAMSRRRSRKPSLMIHFEETDEQDEEHYVTHPAITLCSASPFRRKSSSICQTELSRKISIKRGTRQTDIAEADED